MTLKKEKILAAKSSGVAVRKKSVTNGSPGSVAKATADLGVSLTLRWFPADSTAELNKDPMRKDSKSLNALPIVIGTISGGKFQAIDPKIKRLPEALRIVGRRDPKCFLAADKATQDKFRQLATYVASLKGKPPKDDAGKKKLEEFSQLKAANWRDVKVHQVKMHHFAPGTTVGIYIGVDTKLKFRCHPLWPIKLGKRNNVLDIFETYGPLALNDKASEPVVRAQGVAGEPASTDYYFASLTGDIWLRSTHPFTSADVDALNLEQVTPAMKTALKKIYDGKLESKGANFVLDVPKDPAGATKVRFFWVGGANGNCKDNISRVDLKLDVPVRVHPAAYAAAARAAFDAEVTQIDLSSSWRPMLGAMGHRMGLALDMNWLRGEQALSLKRSGLGKNKATGTISQAEQDAYNEHERAKKELAKAEAEKKRDLVRIRLATEALDLAKRNWSDAVEKNQPAMLDLFRNSLLKAKPLVTQVLDPWYMELNTRDSLAPVPNQQKDQNEKLHSHHLHITIQDPELT